MQADGQRRRSAETRRVSNGRRVGQDARTTSLPDQKWSDPKARETYTGILELFKAWDENGDGLISRQELTRLMRFVTDGQISEDMLDKLMIRADDNCNGFIEMEEFITWVFNPKTGLFSADIMPSRIPAATSPVILRALQEYFSLHDMNRNGSIDLEEFAVSKLMLSRTVGMDQIEEDFQALDKNRSATITWREFQAEYCRLLDAIPRPVEEKADLIRARSAALAEAVQESKNGKPAVRLISSVSEFLQLVKQKYGSISEAFHAIDEDHSGMLSIIELRDCIEQLLGLVPDTRVALHCVRALFRELDQSRDGQVSLEEFESAASRKGGRRHSSGQQPRRTSGAPNSQAVRQEKVKAPLDEALRCVVRLLSRTHWEMRHRLLQKEMAETLPSDTEGLARIRLGIDHLKAEVANSSGGEDPGKFRFWACDAVDVRNVTLIEFEQLVTSCLTKQPGALPDTQTALLGWEIEEIFKALDVNDDGAISVAEWDQIYASSKS